MLTALAVSGLPTDRFTFEGFLPRKPGERRGALRALAREPRTMVFFESPARVAASLADMAAAFGADRRAAVCRELTKLYEEVARGTLAELAEWAAAGVRGELVHRGRGRARRARSPSPTRSRRCSSSCAAGTRLKDAAGEVVGAHRALLARAVPGRARRQGLSEPSRHRRRGGAGARGAARRSSHGGPRHPPD